MWAWSDKEGAFWCFESGHLGGCWYCDFSSKVRYGSSVFGERVRSILHLVLWWYKGAQEEMLNWEPWRDIPGKDQSCQCRITCLEFILEWARFRRWRKNSEQVSWRRIWRREWLAGQASQFRGGWSNHEKASRLTHACLPPTHPVTPNCSLLWILLGFAWTSRQRASVCHDWLSAHIVSLWCVVLGLESRLYL